MVGEIEIVKGKIGKIVNMTNKEQATEKLVNSIQNKVDKIREQRQGTKTKEPQSIDIICTGEDIAKSKR